MFDLESKRRVIKHMVEEKFGFNSEDDELYIEIEREKLFLSFLQQFDFTKMINLAKPLTIEFTNEVGVDAGGPRTEFYTLLNQHIFDPRLGLFKLSGKDRSLQPDPLSVSIPSYLKLFELAGIILAKTILQDMTVDLMLTKSFLKQILGIPILITDMEDLDPGLHKNLQWILENNVDDLHQTFIYETEILGIITTQELVPDGQHIFVTESNKNEYVNKFCKMKMTKEIELQLKAFMKGFRFLLPTNLMSFFSYSELQLLISGMREIDVVDMKMNCNYKGYGEDYQVVIWFWEVLYEFKQEELSSFFFFASGSKRVPFGGFKNMPLTLINSYLDENSLPVSHTCFFQIELPNYSSKEQLKEKVEKAIYESRGFQIA